MLLHDIDFHLIGSTTRCDKQTRPSHANDAFLARSQEFSLNSVSRLCDSDIDIRKKQKFWKNCIMQRKNNFACYVVLFITKTQLQLLLQFAPVC